MWRHPAIRLLAPILLCLAVSARAESDPTTQPADSDAPTTAELLAEIRLLRKALSDQQRQHEKDLKTLQSQIDELKRDRQASPNAGAAKKDTSQPAVSDDASFGEGDLDQLLAGAASGSSESGESEEGDEGAGEASGEAELDQLLAGAAAPPSGAGAPIQQAAPLSIQGAVQSFNPDISLNGDFLASYSNNEGGDPDDEIQLREVELGFSGAVDAYTRADVLATIGREDGEYKADLEEAYITYLGLPYGLQARFGKMRSEFGKVNAIHRHAIPWIDYPYVIKRFFGEEGLSGTGAEVSWLIPNRWDKYLSLTYEVFNNDNDTLFAGQASDDFTHLLRFKTFNDLSPESTLELGASIATAPNDAGHGSHRSTIEGLDLTYRWKPKEAGLYKSFLWQNEVMFAQADIVGGQESTWGMYSAAEYQFARRWKFGVRYDNTQLPFSSSLHERGYSAYLTFLQTEFLFWRLGYLVTDRNFPEFGNENEQQVFLQMNWTLGTHPAHRY